MCKNCYYCTKSTIIKDTNSDMLVLRCDMLNKQVIKFDSIVQTDIDSIKTLANCPLNDRVQNNPILGTTKKPSFLDKIHPQVSLDDIVVGTTYHVPPYFNEKRKDIKIICKFPRGFNYTVVGKKDIEFAYDTDTLAKLMVRAKN